MLQEILIGGIILSIIYIVIVYFDYDRTITMRLRSIEAYIDEYARKPKVDGQRSVVILNCPSGVCVETLKSILDQSVRVDDIAIETDNPDKIDESLRRIVTVHRPNTAPIREGERDTILIIVDNGKTYPYDYIETKIESILKKI